MSRRVVAPAGQSTFEEERNEALESALNGVAERPGDYITRSACTFLLRHLTREAPERRAQGFAPAA